MEEKDRNQQTKKFITGIIDGFNKKINRVEKKVDWLYADVKTMTFDVSSIKSDIEDIESRLNQAGEGTGADFKDLKPWEPEPVKQKSRKGKKRMK